MRLVTHIKPFLRESYWLCLCRGLQFTLLMHLEKTLQTLGHSDVGNSKSFHCSALQLGTSKVCMLKVMQYLHNWGSKTWKFISWVRLTDLLRGKVTWIDQSCVVFFLSLHSLLNLVMVSVRAVQRRLHFFFPVSSSVLMPEVELNRQMRGLQCNASERENSFPPTCTITELIIELFSLCFHHNSPRHAVDFVSCFIKFSRNLMSYCQERSWGVWVFLKPGLVN